MKAVVMLRKRGSMKSCRSIVKVPMRDKSREALQEQRQHLRKQQGRV